MATAAARDRFGLVFLVPLAAWAAQGLFGWFVAAHVCRGAGTAGACFAPGSARALVGLATLVALAATAAALVAARVRSHRAGGRGPVAEERSRFVAFVTLFAATALGIGLLWAGLPLLLLPLCGGGSVAP